MNIRKLLRSLHRDLGYFIVGMTIVYGLSGIFLNHRHDFNPDYKILVTNFKLDGSLSPNAGKDEVVSALKSMDRDVVYKKHYLNNQGDIKVFIENGEVVINPETGKGTMRYLQKRPIIFEMNRLHKSALGSTWKWVSDIMASILIFVAISGLFLLKGKKGFGRRGWWLTIAGIIVPLVFLILYM